MATDNDSQKDPTKDDPAATDLILTGKPQELKPAITLILAMAQLLEGIELGERRTREYHSKRIYRPQVTLFFQGPRKTNEKEYPDKGEISFRLMNKTPKTITKADLEILAQRIKSKFAKPPFQWKKGKLMVSYTHWETGYQFQLLCQTEAEGRRIIEQVLDLNQDSPNWEYMNVIKNALPAKRYPNKRQKETILGEIVELPERRPNVTVQFKQAYIDIAGLNKPIYLVDLTGKKDALVSVD